MRDLDRSGLPSLLFLTTKMHIKGIEFGILSAYFNTRYWILYIFSYTSWLIRPCFYLLYK